MREPARWKRALPFAPELPRTHGTVERLARRREEAGKDSHFRLADAVWGDLPDGHVLGKPVPLFPRIEAPTPAAGN